MAWIRWKFRRTNWTRKLKSMAEVTTSQKLLDTLTAYGLIGVDLLRDDVAQVSVTNKTKDSIRFEVFTDNKGRFTLEFYGREYFKALETGRSPRESSSYGQFDLNLLEYMEAKGWLSGMTDKQKKAKAKSLAWYINKHGDKTHREGGRIVYSKTLDTLVRNLSVALSKDFSKFYLSEIIRTTKNVS